MAELGAYESHACIGFEFVIFRNDVTRDISLQL